MREPRHPLMTAAMLLCAFACAPLAGQAGAAEEDFRAALRRLLPGQPSLPAAEARQRCLSLPSDPLRERVQGPVGDTVYATRCEVVAFDTVGWSSGGHYQAAAYRWTSIVSAEDTSRGPAARDTVLETELVVLAPAEPGRVRPVWHDRIEEGPYAVWRSIAATVASPDVSTTVLAVDYCLNGTGGCGVQLYRRTAAAPWGPVRQVWLAALPADAAGRLRHGVAIDPGVLVAVAGYYLDGDGNCCPSRLLRAQLALAGDSLVLRWHEVITPPAE